MKDSIERGEEKESSRDGEMKGEEDKILNKVPILHPRVYNNGGCFGRTPNPKPYRKTLTDQGRRRRRKSPKWYARSHPKMATPYNGVPPLLL
jgi:hypothetical protein